ncbi:LAQU0S16e01552g1_1 [Lachancea quebecensis]|uniref:LAQU0S16e01552g1_1 n=1 Tax=Lachancea quebecensis TaxID=1654605 RepID=A0A0P1KX23_9SACH|nr:LAQU0S16e01552g1_1 [Lachancea quebecensis]
MICIGGRRVYITFAKRRRTEAEVSCSGCIRRTHVYDAIACTHTRILAYSPTHAHTHTHTMQDQMYTCENVTASLTSAPGKNQLSCSCGSAQDQRLRNFTFPAGRGAARRARPRRVSSDSGSHSDNSCGNSGDESCDTSCDISCDSDRSSTCAYDESPQISPKTIPSMDRDYADSAFPGSMHRAQNSVFSSFSVASSPITRHRRSSAISADKDTFSAARPAWHSPTKRTSDSVFHKRPMARSSPHSFSRPARALIADTSQQLRRNSEPYFLVKAELGLLDCSRAGSTYAGLPQTGDAAPKSINLEAANWDRASGEKTHVPKAMQGPSALLPPIQFADAGSSQEDSSAASAGGDADPDELLSLKEFLLTSG